jgi:hypothetical protein
MRQLFLGLAAFAAFFVAGSAADLKLRTGGWWEHGEETCNTWLEARDARGADELIYRAWVDGYLAGVRRGAGKVPDGPQVASWMDAYCRVHRAATLMDAVKKLKL